MTSNPMVILIDYWIDEPRILYSEYLPTPYTLCGSILNYLHQVFLFSYEVWQSVDTVVDYVCTDSAVTPIR